MELRRRLRLVLAFIWLLDGVLQFQSIMFSRAFSTQILLPTAAGNPAWIKHSITWTSHLISHNPTAWDAFFALIQIALGIGIAWRPTVKLALSASIVWALLVWWFGEGLGGIVTGGANPITGAPGAVLIYALLAVLLWPTRPRDGTASFVAARSIGAPAARLVWLVLWGGLAYFTLQPANRSPQGLHDKIAGLTAGEPTWIATIDRNVSNVLAHHGLEVSIIVAIVLAVAAVGVFLPTRAARVTLAVAILYAAAIWVVGENFGAIFTQTATDPNSGPLLALLAVAYWPLTSKAATPTAEQDSPVDTPISVRW
jgi:hypothetical protein